MEVNDEIHTHHLYKDLIGTHNLYGAESWIKELQRMCEKTYSFFLPRIPDHESGGGYTFSSLLFKSNTIRKSLNTDKKLET